MQTSRLGVFASIIHCKRDLNSTGNCHFSVLQLLSVPETHSNLDGWLSTTYETAACDLPGWAPSAGRVVEAISLLTSLLMSPAQLPIRRRRQRAPCSWTLRRHRLYSALLCTDCHVLACSFSLVALAPSFAVAVSRSRGLP